MDATVREGIRALGRAGRWDQALALLDAVIVRGAAQDDAETALLRADLRADQAFWTATPLPADLLAPIDDADGAHESDGADADTAGGPDQAWTRQWSHARAAYTTLLQDRLAGRGVDVPAARDLLRRLERLHSDAPDHEAGLAVRFHLGLVLENLLGESASATSHWTAAATSTDGDTASSALRHLGGQSADAGDHATAQELWWRSFRLRARDGNLPGALAQLALLARLTPPASLAEAVDAWVEEAGLAVLRGRGLSGDS